MEIKVTFKKKRDGDILVTASSGHLICNSLIDAYSIKQAISQKAIFYSAVSSAVAELVSEEKITELID